MVIFIPIAFYLIGYVPMLGSFTRSISDNFVMGQAIRGNNPILCSFVRLGYDGNPSPGMCYTRVAIANKNVASCRIAANKISSEHADRCFQEVVHQINYRDHDARVEVCEMIQNDDRQKECLEVIKKVEDNPADYGF